MTLARALAHHEGALRASLLAVYGLHLHDHGMPTRALADLVAHLPPGSALWRSMGGPAAWTAEEQVLWLIEHRLRGLLWQGSGGKGERPRPQTPPEPASAVRARESALASRVARFQARRARRRASPAPDD